MKGHIRGLDGLRAFSAAAVACMHFGRLPTGWIGVQVFYVLSGFLITGTLLSSKESCGSFGGLLKRFYLRRTMRIMPLYLIYVLLAFLLSWFTIHALPERAAVPWLLTYTFNIYRVLHFNELTAHLDMTTPLWSLSVEEQFYIFWPLAVYFLSRKHFQWFALATFAVSPLLRWALIGNGAAAMPEAYFLTPFQLDGFAAGAILSTLSQQRMQALRKPLLMAAAVLTTLILVRYHKVQHGGLGWLMDHDSMWIWAYTWIDLCAALLVLDCIVGSPLTGLLELRPLRYLGRISYSFYVWHVGVLLLFYQGNVRFQGDGKARLVLAAYLVACTAVAALSYHFIERPGLRLKDRLSRPSRLGVPAATMTEAR